MKYISDILVPLNHNFGRYLVTQEIVRPHINFTIIFLARVVSTHCAWAVWLQYLVLSIFFVKNKLALRNLVYVSYLYITFTYFSTQCINHKLFLLSWFSENLSIYYMRPITPQRVWIKIKVHRFFPFCINHSILPIQNTTF